MKRIPHHLASVFPLILFIIIAVMQAPMVNAQGSWEPIPLPYMWNYGMTAHYLDLGTLGYQQMIVVNPGQTVSAEISGYVRLYSDASPITPNSVFAGCILPNTGPGGTPALPVRLELLNSTGKVVKDTTVNVPADASSVSYSIKELYEYKGILTGTYTLTACAFGFLQTATISVSVTVTAPSPKIDSPLVRGGGIIGNIYYHTMMVGGFSSSTTLGSGKTILVETFDESGALKGVWIGTTTTAVTSTSYKINGAGESIIPVAPANHTTVPLKTCSSRGVRDGGLATGRYTIKVSVEGFTQPTPYPTLILFAPGTLIFDIRLFQGGIIDVTTTTTTSPSAITITRTITTTSIQTITESVTRTVTSTITPQTQTTEFALGFSILLTLSAALVAVVLRRKYG